MQGCDERSLPGAVAVTVPGTIGCWTGLTGPPAGALTTATAPGATTGTPGATTGTAGVPGWAAGIFAGAAIGGPTEATIGFPGSALTRVPGVKLVGALIGARATSPGTASGASAGTFVGTMPAASIGAGADAPPNRRSRALGAGAGAGKSWVVFPERSVHLAMGLRLLSLSHVISF